jgi:hypothetical protein
MQARRALMPVVRDSVCGLFGSWHVRTRLHYDFVHRGMGVYERVREVIDCSPVADRRDDFVNQHRRLVADDVTPENLAGFGVGEYLYEPVVELQRPAHRGVGKLGSADDVLRISILQYRFGSTDRTDLWLGENGVRKCGEIGFSALFTRNVLDDDFTLVVLLRRLNRYRHLRW